MNINEIHELKEKLINCVDYPAILPDRSRDTDVDKIIALIGKWYRDQVSQKLPVNFN